MAVSRQTDKSRFPSKYTDGFISEAQYVTEKLCELIACRQGKDLSNQFWKSLEWEKVFKAQIPSAAKLLKKYTVKAILAALRDFRLKNVYSLRAKWIVPIIEEYQTQFNATKQYGQAEKSISKIDPSLPDSRVNIFKPTIIDKLKDLDG